MTARTPYVETFLISLAAILLDVSYTRVFSFKLAYYFTYLIIGISLLGLGAGGVFVAISTRLRRSRALPLIPACCLAGSGAVFVGYVAVARIQLNAFELISSLGARVLLPSLREGAKLALICTSLFIPFFMAGLALATIFATQTERINRLYFADLLAAGLGFALRFQLITTISPTCCVLLPWLVFAAEGAR